MATRLIALYDDIDHAHEAVGALMDAGFAPDSIDMVARDVTGKYEERYKNANDDDVSAGEGAGFGAIVGGLIGLGVALIPGIGLVAAAGPVAAAIAGGAIGAGAGAVTGGITGALVDLGVDEDEAQYYAESLRRGAALVSVLTTDANLEQARDILDSYDPEDVERRADYYQATGWTGYNPKAEPYNERQVQEDRTRYNQYLADHDAKHNDHDKLQRDRMTSGDTQDVKKFDVVEEELQVGKREVESGTVRVQRHVTEEPVEEHVRLREEKVNVERHPVNREATDADLKAFEEGEIELTERREEPVISKQARVVEEVVVRKDVDYRDETVRDTVRRSDVEVEGAEGADRRVDYQPFDTYDADYRRHYQGHFANRGYTYDQYQPAYRYGYNLATSPYYGVQSWEVVEPEARRRWEEHNQDTWEQFKDAVREGWNRVKSAVS